MLLGSNNPEISKVVRTRADRRDFALPNDIDLSPGSRNSVLKELSIPADIGDDRQDSALSSNARLSKLQARKQELRDQLIQYDMNFVIQHGHVPDEREKEPIRELYEQYNALKSHICDSKESIGRTNPTGAPSAPAQDIATLKIERGRLHQMLRSFEEGFFKENQRQVQSFADIRPVASQYCLYKKIKRVIAALQRGEGS
jgi:hypothetical protein